MEIHASPGLIWLIAALPVVVLAHELGHALTARFAGYRVSSFGFGHSPGIWNRFLRFRRGRCTLYLGLHWWAGGRCVAVPVRPRPGRIWLHQSGGLWAQAILALPLFLLASRFEGAELAYWFNALVLAINVLPWRIGGRASDGWHLLGHDLGAKSFAVDSARRRQLKSIHQIESAVGSEFGRVWCRLALARLAVVAGRGHEVQDFLSTEFGLDDPHLEGLRAHVLAEWHRLESRPLASLQVCAKTRDRLGAELSELVEDLLNLSEARAYVALSEPERASRVLARVAGVEGVLGREALVIRLEIALLENNAEAVERVARRCIEQLRASFLDSAQAIRALGLAASLLERDGRRLASTACNEAARKSAEALLRATPVKDRMELAYRVREVLGGVPPAEGIDSITTRPG